MKSLKNFSIVLGVLVLLSFSSFQAKPTAHIDATEMNIIYKGIDNPIAISAPGIAANELVVSTSGGTLIPRGGGQFYLKTAPGTKELTITVALKMEGGNRVLNKKKFRVRRIPTPRAQLGGLMNDGLPKAKAPILAQMRLLTTMGPGFAYNLRYSVASYHCTIIAGNERTEFDVEGQDLTPDIQRKMRTLGPKDLIIFNQIKATEPKYEILANPAPILIEIRD